MKRTVDIFVHRLWDTQVFRAATCGTLAAIVQTVFFETLAIWFAILTPSQAVLVSAEFATLTNFFLNHHITFTNSGHKRFLVRLAQFHIAVTGSLFIQWFCMFVAEHVTKNTWVINGTYGTGILLGFACSYTWYRLWVWKTLPSNARWC